MKKALAFLWMLPVAMGQVYQPAQIPEETAGLERIAGALLSTFDQAEVLAIADTHQRKVDSDLRLAVVRHPEFARKVRFVLAEFAGAAEQAVLDRYIYGDNVTPAELQRVWTNTCCPGTWSSPVYAEFLAAVREVNRGLPADQWIRVLGGDPPAGTPSTERDRSAVTVLKSFLGTGKTLIVYGGGHLRYNDLLAQTVRAYRPQGLFVVESIGGTETDYSPLERSLTSPVRPVLFSVAGAPFNRLVGDVSAADAVVYFGNGPNADTFIRAPR